MSLPLVGVDHKPVEVGVFLDDLQRNHLSDIGVAVLQLVQFQIDLEQIFPDSVRTGLQTATHDVPVDGNNREETLKKKCPHKFCFLGSIAYYLDHLN